LAPQIGNPGDGPVSDTRDWNECHDITDAIVLIVDTRLRLPTEILKRNAAGMQF